MQKNPRCGSMITTRRLRVPFCRIRTRATIMRAEGTAHSLAHRPSSAPHLEELGHASPFLGAPSWGSCHEVTEGVSRQLQTPIPPSGYFSARHACGAPIGGSKIGWPGARACGGRTARPLIPRLRRSRVYLKIRSLRLRSVRNEDRPTSFSIRATFLAEKILRKRIGADPHPYPSP